MKVRVAHIITRLDLGGSATSTIETCARLNPQKYELDLIVGRTNDPDGSIQSQLTDRKINVVYIDSLRREISLWHDLVAFIKLYQAIRQGKYDIVHTHSSKAGLLGRWAAWWARVKYIIHTPHGHVFYGYFGPVMTKIIIYLERLASGVSKKVITLTDIGKKEHVDFKIGPEELFTTIYSGVDIDAYRFDQQARLSIRQKHDIAPEAFIFGTMARLDPIKGNDLVVRAFAQAQKEESDIYLLLVGDGSQKEELIQLVSDLKLKERVIFTGFQSDVCGYLSAADVFVLGSRNEGMGRAVIEAMACSRPVIATRVGGVPELITDGKEGLLVGSDDEQGMAEAIKKFRQNQDLCVAMAQAAYEKASEKFSLKKMIEDIDHLYDEVLQT